MLQDEDLTFRIKSMSQMRNDTNNRVRKTGEGGTSSWAEYSSSLVVQMVLSLCSLRASMSACSFIS